MATVNHHKRQIFNKSYLKSIQCILTFDKIEWTEKLKSSAIALLTDKKFVIKETGELPMIQAQRNMTIVVLSDKGLLLTTDKVDYGGFEAFKKFLSEVMMELLKVAGVENVTTSIFQKSNSYRVNKSKVKIELTKDIVLSTLFTPLLLDAKVPLGVMENDCFYTSQYKYDDKGDTIIIELVVSAMKPQEQSIQVFFDGLTATNDRLYDFWYESVGEKVRKSMEG